MLTAVALLVAAFCVAASARRLRFATVPTGTAPDVLLRVIARTKSVIEPARILEQAVASEPGAPWEDALVEALRAAPAERVALVNEQLTELDYLVQKWARVPRVCASICTSSGFLLAAMVLRDALAAPAEAMSGEAVDAAVLQAIDVASVGLAGAVICVAIQLRARKAASATAASFDRLVEQLERGVIPSSPGAAEAAGSLSPSK